MALIFALLALLALVYGLWVAIQAVRYKQKMPKQGIAAFGVGLLCLALAGMTAPKSDGGQNSNEQAKCEDVSPDVVAAILQNAPEAKLENVKAVRASIEGRTLYVVAGKFTSPRVSQGSGSVDATWLTDSLSSQGQILSAGPFATMGSTWPDAANTSLHFYGSEPEVMRAIQCVDPSTPLELPETK